MVHKALKHVVVAAMAVAAFAWQPAAATPIIGNVSFSDGFTSLSPTNTAVVSDLVNINVASSTLAQACSGVFATGAACVPSVGTFASSFVLNSPIAFQIVYTYNDFVFTVTSLTSAITRSGLVCGGGTCTDSLAFNGTGIVTGPAGFDPGTFSMAWTAQGSCTVAAAAPVCAPGPASGFWQARVSAIPEPGTLALFGLSVVLLRLVRRRAVG